MERKSLHHWLLWLFVSNSFCFALMGLFYWVCPWRERLAQELSLLEHHTQWFLIATTCLSYCGYCALLSAGICCCVALASYIFLNRTCAFLFSSMLSSVFAFLLLLDATFIYPMYGFHFSGIIARFMISAVHDSLLGLSEKELGVIICTFVSLLVIFWGIHHILWHWAKKGIGTLGLKISVVFLLGSIFFSYTLLSLIVRHSVTWFVYRDATQFLPLYHVFLGHLGFMDDKKVVMRVGKKQYIRALPSSFLPLNHLQTEVVPLLDEKKFNLVIIVVDAWRFDMLDAQITPFLYQFAEESLLYRQHYSGGNATGPGIFSMLYSLPAGYWEATKHQKQGPILFNALLKNNFRIGIFSSAPLSTPDLEHTVFSSIKNIPYTEGKNPYLRDKQVTHSFVRFLKNRHPGEEQFFSFIFYDAAHGYCAYDDNLKPRIPVIAACNRYILDRNTDKEPYINRYKNSLILVDDEVHRVIQALKKENLYDKTVIVVTADHGEEFNDNHLGYWGHASNFSPYQIHVPLIVHWPNTKAQKIDYVTTHYDIVPTLMKHLLHYDIPTHQYSVGTGLDDAHERPYFIVASYNNFAIVHKEKRLIVNPDGEYSIQDKHAHVLPYNGFFDLKSITAAFNDLQRFYGED